MDYPTQILIMVSELTESAAVLKLLESAGNYNLQLEVLHTFLKDYKRTGDILQSIAIAEWEWDL